MYSLLALLILVRATLNFGYVDVNVIYKWTYVEFDWKSQKQMEDAMHSGNYVPKKCLFYDAIKTDDGRVFIVTSNEFGSVCPATLNTVTKKMGKSGGPLLRPYPDWSSHNNSCKCSEKRILNANRIFIRCNHLFVLDNGKVGMDQVCNPKLLIFDLNDDTLVRTIYIPIDIASNKMGSGRMTTPVAYVPGSCSRLLNEMIVFMTDVQGFGLIVYNSITKSICRVESDYMKPNGTAFYIGNQTVPYIADLYYAAGTGNKIYKININVLLKCPNKEQANKQTKLVIKLAAPTGQIVAAGNAILYSNGRAMNILGTNVCTKCKNNTVEIAQNSEVFQPITGMVVSHYWNKLTCLSNGFPHYFFNTVNLKDIVAYYFELDLTAVQNKINSVNNC